MSDWSTETYPYIRLERDWNGILRGKCGNCHETCGWKGVNSCTNCGQHFTQITSPYEHEAEWARELRPDLEYVVFQWG